LICISDNSVVAIIEDADRVVAQKRLPNDITKIVGFLAQWQDELTGVVVESTYNWYWLVDGLQDAGLQVHLANTAAIKQYGRLKHSGDEADARLRRFLSPSDVCHLIHFGHQSFRVLERRRRTV
jgi:transposase